MKFYLKVSKTIFECFYGPLSRKTLIALLPSYQEQSDSSLIAMVDAFMQYTHQRSGYFEPKSLDLIQRLQDANDETLLLGVSYALLDLAETNNDFNLKELVFMETGGMKGRRKEMTRQELHHSLITAFKTERIHSEYGMTELLSQAYSLGSGDFSFPTWCKTLIRDINDPFAYLESNRVGAINIIDLANIDSCCFIETKDLGKVNDDQTFQVLGRMDNADVRGCNLLMA